MAVTLGDQLRSADGVRLHSDEKVQLRESCFIQYLTYNEENQRREIGCRDRGFSVPFGDILIRVCQKHMQSHVLRRTPPNPAFKQQEVFAPGDDGNFVRMDSDERPAREGDIGDGIGLSKREKQWRCKRLGQHRKQNVAGSRPSDVSDVVGVDETSSGDDQVRPTQTRLSQHSAPKF